MEDTPFGYVQDGVSDVAGGMQFGMAHFANDMARLGSSIQPIMMAPQAQAAYQHHGMVMYEMGTGTALGAASGLTTAPRYMSEVEWRQSGAETLASNVAGAATYGTVSAVSGFGLAGLGMAVPFSRLGRRAAQQGARLMGGGPMAGGTGVSRWIRSSARAGSMAARAGAFTGSMGLGTTAGISIASGMGGVAMAGGTLMASMVPFMVADAAVSRVVDEARERSEIQDYIQASSFRYAPPSQGTAADTFGGGYGRKAAGQIAEGIMRYGVENPAYDLGELKGILQKGTQIGLFNSTKDATDFQNRFKETADALKTVTKIMHQTLSEGLDTIKAMRDIGVTSPSTQIGMLARSDVLGMASGKTASEMFTIGLQGAQMFRGTGVSMAAGAGANQAMFASLTEMQRQGLISSEQIAQMGGMEAFSQSMVGNALRNAQSPMGRAMLMATSVTGKFDPQRLADIATGKMGYQQALYETSRAASNPMTFIDMQLNQEKNLGDALKSFGDMGATILPMSQAMMISQETLRGMRQPLTQENQRKMMQYVLRTKMGYSVEQSDAMIKQLDNVEEMQKNRQAATQQTALKMTTDAYVDRYGIGNQFVRDYRQTVDSTLGAMGRGLGRLNDDITTGVTGWYNRNVLGMGPQANLNFNTLTERNALLDSLPALQLTPAQQMQERGAAFQRAAGVSEDVSPFKATALGVGVGLAVAGIGVATGGLGFVAGAAALAGGATLGGGTGFLASLGSAFNQRSTTVADLAFKHGELKDSDLAKKEDPDAIRVGDGKYVKKGALDRVSEKYKGTLRVSAEDISKDITKDMSSGQLNTFMATRSHSLDDVGMARVVMADMDVSLLSPEKQQAYRSKQAELNKYGPASAEAVSKMNTEFVDKLAITDFSEKGQQIYVGIRGMRGEHKLAAEKLNIASGAAGVDVKQLGSVQEKLRDATDQLKGSYRGAIVKAGAFSETGDTREGLGDAQELATTILDSPNGLTLMHDLNSGDENKRTNARATLQQRLSNTEYYRNKGPAEITKAVDKISENVSRSDNIKQRLADYQTYALSEKNIKSQILYDSAVKNLDSVKSKANLTADQAQQLETAFVKNINGDVSDVEAINNAKALVSTLETTGAGNYLPTMKRAAQLATTLENVETADIKGISQILGREVTREELRAKGVAETRKALALKGQQDAGAVAIATEEGTTAGLSGMPQMAAALKVVEEQTRAVAQAVQILTGINTNMNAQPALGGKRGWGQ